jgi:hypothetical protein
MALVSGGRRELRTGLRIGALILSSAALMFVAGCATVFAPGTTIIDHDKGASAEPQEAPSDGEYALYARIGDNSAKHTVSLKRGDLLGFKTGQTGQIIAVAGNDEWVMTDNSYIWKRLSH